MKRFLSLIIAVVMVLSLGVATVFAADFGYNVHNFTSGANAMNSDGVIPIFVRSVGATIGGTFKLQYDATKVIPMVYSTYTDDETGEDVVAYSEATASTPGSDLVVYVKASNPGAAAQRFDLAAATIEVDAYSGSALANNAQYVKIYFKALDGTTDNWNANTFKIVSGFVKDADQNQYDFGAGMAATHTYTNATVVVEEPDPTPDPGEGGDDPVVEETAWDAVEDGVKDTWGTQWAANFSYKTAEGVVSDAAYAGKKVVAFGKNGSANKYAAGNYGIKIGANTYPGAMDVPAGGVFAIVLIDTNNDTKVGDTSYTYSIWAKNDLGEEVAKSAALTAIIAQ